MELEKAGQERDKRLDRMEGRLDRIEVKFDCLIEREN